MSQELNSCDDVCMSYAHDALRTKVGEGDCAEAGNLMVMRRGFKVHDQTSLRPVPSANSGSETQKHP